MKVLVQINVTLNQGSTGRIAEGIAEVAHSAGWKCYIVHGSRYVNHSNFESMLVSSPLEEKIHYAKSLLLDSQGLGSENATKRLVSKLIQIKPDIIHLHVIHGSFINYKILFEFIKEYNIPVVWTFHDCWAFTGHCAYFDRINCKKWMSLCYQCPQKNSYPRAVFIDMSKRNFILKRFLFSSIDRCVIVPVSNWLGSYVKKSFLGDKLIHVIHNGINVENFRPIKIDIRKKYSIESDKIIILGVANGFGKRKGLDDFIKLSRFPEFQIILVGTTPKEKSVLPPNIISISRTESVNTLIELYSSSDVFVNPTYEDNFPTTNLEALACGIPVVTYNTGGSPEALDKDTGIVVPKGNISELKLAIKEISSKDKESISKYCRNRAITLFNQKKCFEEYLFIYEKLLRNN